MAAPSLLTMALLLGVPLAWTLVWSFQHVTYGGSGTWAGVGNYADALGDPVFRSAATFTVLFSVVKTASLILVAFSLALLLNRVGRLRAWFLGFLMIPYVTPAVIAATAFAWLFDSNFGGVLNHVIEAVTGHEFLWFAQAWPNRVLLLLGVVWQEMPFALLILLAALQGVDESTLEAARVDGAGWWSQLRYIVIPWLAPMFRFVALISLMDGLRMFDMLVPLSPSSVTVGNSSMMQYVFNVSLRDGSHNLGLGSAVNILTMVLIAVLLVPMLWGQFKERKSA
ncbi:carbohydrate ABC transporter permease [Streptomyces sp. NPDC001661]